ncbi:LORF2 protein, partial [Crocuta crocuta]
KINNSGNNRCWRGCRERGDLLHGWSECQWVQPLWKTVWRFLKNLKIDLPDDPDIALAGIYPRDTGALFQGDTCPPMFTAALSTVAKVWEEPKCPSTDEWIKKMWFIYTMEYHSAIEKNEILPFATMWMELEGIMFSE